MANAYIFLNLLARLSLSLDVWKEYGFFSPDFFSLFQNMHKYTYLYFSNLVIKNEIFLFPLTLTILVLY